MKRVLASTVFGLSLVASTLNDNVIPSPISELVIAGIAAASYYIGVYDERKRWRSLTEMRLG